MNHESPLALPQQAQIEQVMAQNQAAMQHGARSQAVALAIQFGAGGGIGTMLNNARHICHFIQTGQVPSGAKQDG